MDFVDEEDIPFLEVGQQPRQVARLLDSGAAGALDVGLH